ncbi:MAG: metallophosphoesterase [Chloroflexota bacterium]
MTTIFYATDIHGSDICWNKFLNAGKFYNADVLVLGGDMTGKAIVPVVELQKGVYQTTLLQQNYSIQGPDELADMTKRIRSRGYYPYLTTQEEIEELAKTPDLVYKLFIQEALKVIEQWMEIADRKLAGTSMRVYVSPGNDDRFEVDDIIRAHPSVTLAEGQVINIDQDHEMITSGWSNKTPWNTYREEDEPELAVRYKNMISGLKNPKNSLFNIHVPPFNSNLDEAPELDEQLRPRFAGNSLKPTGSTALREAIEKFQPLLGLHGHIHEGRGSSRIGRTLCINPGSMYEQGTLLGSIIKLGKNKIDNYVLTSG